MIPNRDRGDDGLARPTAPHPLGVVLLPVRPGAGVARRGGLGPARGGEPGRPSSSVVGFRSPPGFHEAVPLVNHEQRMFTLWEPYY